ncbi:MAG: HEAT repeat domain-containing protein, partial [Nitrospira sp.]|nr:HEAT repeat domain-containing protein [Nitrospira sp.]
MWMILFSVATLWILLPDPAWAYRDYLTSEQKTQLAKIQTVLIDALALTDKGAADAGPIAEIASRGLRELAYTVVQDRTKPHDAVFKVKCEQRKTWEGTTAAGGDADLPDAPSRLWKGPACQLTYFLGEMKIKWQKEVRTNVQDIPASVQSTQAEQAGTQVIASLAEALGKYDFPLLLTAEWGQPDRLLKLLDSAGTSQTRKVRIISLLGEMQADEALPRLKQALQDRNLSKEAAVALGNLGQEGIPILANILKTSNQPELQAAAAKGLGTLGGLHGDGSVVDPLLSMLEAPGIDIRVQTEIVWALGKIIDKRSLP